MTRKDLKDSLLKKKVTWTAADGSVLEGVIVKLLKEEKSRGIIINNGPKEYILLDFEGSKNVEPYNSLEKIISVGPNTGILTKEEWMESNEETLDDELEYEETEELEYEDETEEVIDDEEEELESDITKELGEFDESEYSFVPYNEGHEESWTPFEYD